MASMTSFCVSRKSRLLGPGANAVRPVVEALKLGHSVYAGGTGADPIRTSAELQQTLNCQTSGSTGQPKVIRRKPASWISSFELSARRFGITDSDCYAILGSLGHSLTLFALFEALHIGADVVCLTGQRPQTQADTLRKDRVSILYATPTQLRLLLATNGGPLPDLRHVFVGGGALDERLRDALKQHLSATVHEFFGASETSFITMSNADTPKGSVGMAYPGVTLRIGDGLPPMETGEIWVKSPYLFQGYAQGNSQDTRWDRDFLSIGELGYLDPQGNLFMRGRKTRMVTVSDKNVFPEEIERVLVDHPAVAHAAVLSQPDTMRGNVIEAVIEPCQNSRTDGLEPILRKLCRDSLGPQCAPRRVWFIRRMPLLSAGKPDLQALYNLPLAKTGESA